MFNAFFGTPLKAGITLVVFAILIFSGILMRLLVEAVNQLALPVLLLALLIYALRKAAR